MSQSEQSHVSPTTLAPVIPTLRPYQQQLISEIYQEIRAGNKRIVAFAPTGAGKTLVAAWIVSQAVSKNRRVLIIVHRDILVDQTYQKLIACGVNNCGFIKSGWKENREALVQIASVQSLLKRSWWHNYPAEVIVIDEAHIVAYAAIVQKMMNLIYPQAIYLALSATPWRTSKRESLGDIFQVLVSAPMPTDLIDAGYLIKPSYFCVSLADLEMVGTTVNGDFDPGQLALSCNRPELVQQIVRDWQRLAWGRRTIAFAVNVSHAKHLAASFMAAGIPADVVTGATPDKQTNQIYQQLASGQIQILCSCAKLTEGFDLPSVSAVLLCRPTMSKALHFQMIGRGLRLSPETQKVDAIIIDQAGNIQRHGFVEDLKQISLEHSEQPQDLKAVKKVCPVEKGGCGAYLYAFHMKCCECGYVFEPFKRVYLVPALEELISEADIERYQYYRVKLREAYQKNFVPGWAAHIFREKYGHWPPDSWARGAIFGDRPIQAGRSDYHKYLNAIAQRQKKPQVWVQRYINLEFGFESTAI